MEKPRARRLSRHVLYLMSLFALLAVGGMALFVHAAIVQADDASLDWQRQLVEHAMEEHVKAISRDQASVTYWDDAVVQAQARDLGWLHENLGEWMFEYFGHDRTLVLAPEGQVIYAMSDGLADQLEHPPPAVTELAAAFAPNLAALRARLARGDETGNPFERATLRLAGRPAIVSAMPILPHSDRLVVAPGTEFVLVSLQYLERTFLAKLRDGYRLADARIAATGVAGNGETQLPLLAAEGEPVAWLVWNPKLPGQQILAATLPLTAGAGLVLMACVGVLTRHVYRTSAAFEASEAQALHLAFHDSLTGLPNRAQLVQRLDQVLLESGRRNAALLILDLDRFKEVNDTFGHHAGDEVIREFASRAALQLRRSDTIARLGGDEFAILLDGIASEAEVVAIAERLLQCGQEPYLVTGGKAVVGVSIGYAMLEPMLDRGEMLRRADIALYGAKRAGRNGHCAFTRDMDTALRSRHQIEQDLREALNADGGGLLVHYQPLVGSRDGVIRGVEALVRWEHPRLGAIAPAAFVPIAEEAGLVASLDEWVLRRACRDAAGWGEIALSVNVSPLCFAKAGLAERILAILGEEGFDPTRLEVEVTETVLLDETAEVAAQVRQLRAAGVRIALDDFGTGYSSLGRLCALEVDKVKVDRSFIQHLGQGTDSTAIVDAIIELGHSLGLIVTAEGVETELQRDYLRAAGCDQVQGFLFSRPVPAAALTALVAARSASERHPMAPLLPAAPTASR